IRDSDNTALNAIEHHTQVGFAKDAGAMLLIELDGNPAAVNEDIAKVTGLCQQCNAYKIQQSENSQESANWLTARRSILKALRSSNRFIILISFLISRSTLVEWLETMSSIVKKHNMFSCIFGNAGSGKLQLAIVGDALQKVEYVNGLIAEIAGVTAQLRGTITGIKNDAVARISVPHLKVGEQELEIMCLIKSAFDPHNLFPPVKFSY
ncbi:MAG: hypothetical protein N2246_09435, partial [Candidatus Sumerlaeia bacterium]|nr:hypothetical protein [Candidatus Sumerlaeia bacterium]